MDTCRGRDATPHPSRATWQERQKVSVAKILTLMQLIWIEKSMKIVYVFIDRPVLLLLLVLANVVVVASVGYK